MASVLKVVELESSDEVKTARTKLSQMLADLVALNEAAVAKATAEFPERRGLVRIEGDAALGIWKNADALIGYAISTFPRPARKSKRRDEQDRQVARIFSTDPTDVAFRTNFAEDKSEMDDAVVPIAVVRALMCDVRVKIPVGGMRKSAFQKFSRRYQKMILNLV